MEKKSNVKRGLTLLVLCIAGSVIYELPYISYYYYDLMLEAFNINNTQMGFLMSLFGFVSMFAYFPGGWLADKVSTRLLITFSLLVTGGLGFVFATYPPYGVLLVLYAAWGFLTAGTFWASMLKSTRLLGDSSEQGRLFGILESGRGLIPIIYGMAILALFTAAGASVLALKTVILCFSTLCVGGGILSWFAIKDDPQAEVVTKTEEPKQQVTAADVVTVLKMPQVWLCALVIFCAYNVYIGFSYTTPYLTEMFGFSAETAAFVGILRTYGFGVIGGLGAGILADKVGSNSKVIFVVNCILLVSLAAFFSIKAEPANVVPVLVAMIFMGFGIFMLRGIYFALMDEIKIPIAYCGTAIGVASFVGYMPEAFLYTLYGNWLDTYPGVKGYQLCFGYLVAITVVAVLISLVLYRSIKKQKAQATKSNQSAIAS